MDELELFKKDNIRIYKNEFKCYFLTDGSNVLKFIPYKVNYNKFDNSGRQIYFDIDDFKELLEKYLAFEPPECPNFVDIHEIDNILAIIYESHIKDVEDIWQYIEYIQNLNIVKESETTTEELKPKKKKKRKRAKMIPFSMCRNIDDIPTDKEIVSIDSYVKTLDKHDYLIDLFQTSDNKYYCKFTDITNNTHKPVDFNWMKQKYSMPTLFDFLEI